MSFKAFWPSESPTARIKNSAQKEQKALSLGTQQRSHHGKPSWAALKFRGRPLAALRACVSKHFLGRKNLGKRASFANPARIVVKHVSVGQR